MTDLLLKNVSPQAVQIYQELQRNNPKTAKELGRGLKIFPHAVYRAVEVLLKLGIVEIVKGYPIRYRAKPETEALASYMNAARQDFQALLKTSEAVSDLIPVPQLTFLRTRNEMIKMANKDSGRAQFSIKVVVSGHEVPAETLLIYKRAVERGVIVKVVFQSRARSIIETFQNWQKMGIEARYYPNMEARIIVVDERVVYFTSYNPKARHEALGMRFVYPPYAQLMDELFEYRWQAGTEIGGVLR